MIDVELRDKNDGVVTTLSVEDAKMHGVRRVTYKQKHYKNVQTWLGDKRMVFREVDKPLRLG